MSSPTAQAIRADDPVELLGHDRILSQALPLFAHQGYGGVSMREIARAAGLTIGTLYHYFESKHALYLAMLERVYRQAAAHWGQLLLDAPSAPRERLALYVHEYCAFVAANPDFVRLMKREQLNGEPQQMRLQATALLAEQYQATVRLFEQLAPDRNATLLAHSLIGLVVHHYETRELRKQFADYCPQHDDPAFVAGHITSLLLASIDGHGGRPPEETTP
ncbi:TetR/AcrR family transcriptional regulator [Immundisolibacter sp.]